MLSADWSDLQAFHALAESGQLARAGQLAGVDATTIGRRVRRLEARLGAILFEQGRDGQALTEAGRRLAGEVAQMAGAASRIGGRVSVGEGLTGTLRLSVSEGFGSWVLARHAGALHAAHPGLTLDLVASPGFLNLSKREADLAVVLSRPQAGPLVARKLADYALGLYAAPAYLDAAGTPAGPADLAGHILVGYVPDLLYSPELDYMREIAPGSAAVLRSSSINAQARMIASGAGIGVLPCFIGESQPGLVRLWPQRRIVRSLWLAMHKDTHQSARIAAIKDWLVALVAAERQVLLPD